MNTDTPVGELGEVYVPSQMFAFHEYAIGNAALLYEGALRSIIGRWTCSPLLECQPPKI